MSALAAFLGFNLHVHWDLVSKWLKSDPAHWLAIPSVVLLFALWELYRVERDSEGAVKVRVLNVAAQFHDIQDAPKILAIQSTLRFHNGTNEQTRAYFPKIEVLCKIKRSKWTSIPITSNLALGADIYPRGHIVRMENWYPDQKFQILPRDETDASFNIECEIPKDLLDRVFKIKFSIEIIGQRSVIVDSVVVPEIKFA